MKQQTTLNKDDSKYYWGEIKQTDMELAIDIAEKKGWKVAIDEILDKSYPGLKNMVTSYDRIDWIKRIETDQYPKKCLDIGSGWGQTSFLLALKPYRTVYSLEIIELRNKFQEIRAKQENLKNLHSIQGNFFDSDINNQDNFDLITFIGVLEWVGTDKRFEDAKKAQITALKKANNLLSKEGTLCIGIENRWGFNNFLGAIDHSGLRFTSLLPRKVADLYMKIRQPTYRSNKPSKEYRTYTYSINGYKDLLKEAGYTNIEVLIAHPHYAHPRTLLDTHSSRSIFTFFRQTYSPNSRKDMLFSLLFQFTSLIGLGAFLAPHYIILAKKQ